MARVARPGRDRPDVRAGARLWHAGQRGEARGRCGNGARGPEAAALLVVDIVSALREVPTKSDHSRPSLGRRRVVVGFVCGKSTMP